MGDSNRYSAAEAAALMAAGKLTAVELAGDCLGRINERNPELDAWCYINPEQVLAQAKACDREPRRSPLHGIPIGVKDIFDTADMPTSYGSSIYAEHRPSSDSACVTILRNAGAIIMGKTVTVEFAVTGYPSKTHNPHNPAHTSGGSSSGSAAAVADFMVPLALGTERGGSTTRPAAFCGIVGFKPTFNAVNRAGAKPIGDSFDTVGLMGRTVADVRLLFSVLTDSTHPHLFGTPDILNQDGLTIGFCRTAQWKYADSATMDAVEKAVSTLATTAARIKEVVLPRQFDQMLSVHRTILDYESWRSLSYELRTFPEKLSKDLVARFKEATHCTLAEYLTAQEVATSCRQLLKQVFEEYDVLLTPSAPGEAPLGLKGTGNAIFNRMWTALYTPSVTVPVFTGPSKLPMGLQLVGPFGADYKTLACAEWVHHRLTS